MSLIKKYFDQAAWLLEDPGMIELVTISSAALDAGNTAQGTHILRSGLVLGTVTSGGEYKEYDDNDSDGTEVASGILIADVDLKDGDTSASASDHKAYILKQGRVDSSRLIGYDAAAAVDLAKGGTGGCWIIFE